MSENKLVYSTDPAPNKKCPRCQRKILECKCPPVVELKSNNFVVKLSIEKSGRGGKTVTVIDGLPKINVFLKDLTRKLKNRCGSGGTYLMDGMDGKIEIQGDKRDMIRTLLVEQGMKVKG